MYVIKFANWAELIVLFVIFYCWFAVVDSRMLPCDKKYVDMKSSVT